MNIHELLTAFEHQRARKLPMALVTVVATDGSTYAKAGHQMLIGADGSYTGLISGGCLEADLIERARPVIASGGFDQVSYDMRDRDDDALWGLGLGCNGSLRLALHGLTPDNRFEPFATLAAILTTGRAAFWAVLLAGDQAAIGHWHVGNGNDADDDNTTGNLASVLDAACRYRRHAARAGIDTQDLDDTHCEIFSARIEPVFRLFVIGAGPDVVPLARLATTLGWQTHIVDHRPAYVERLQQAIDTPLLQVELHQSGERHPQVAKADAVVVMSHHLTTDAAWLGQLADSTVPYIGLLGPPDRRVRLMEMLGDRAAMLQPRLHGPIGLNIGADGPETIALAICAQIQAHRQGRNGGHMAQR